MTPQLRFPEFTDEWQVKKLGDIFEFKRTNSLSRAQLSEDGKVGNIHYGDIHKSLPTLLDASKVKLPMIVSSKQFNTADAIKIGDVILADASEDYADIGKAIEVVNLNHGQEVYSGLHTFLMRPAYPSAHGFNGMLFKTATIRKQLMRIATGISVLGVSKNNVSQLVVATPSKPEQEKIADFLTAVDERIAVGEKKLELLEAYKRGVMQKIFSQQIRFKDENGNEYPEWEEKKLGEIASFVNGYTFLSSTYDKSGKYSIITIANVQEGRMDTTKASRVKDIPFNIKKDQILQRNDILISMTGNVGRVCKVDTENCLLNQRVGKIVTNAASDDFVFAVLNSKKFLVEMESLAQGGAQGNLSSKDIMKYKFLLPTYNEQQKIATFLTTLDEKIAAEKSKLTAARQFKKALLQRMFA